MQSLKKLGNEIAGKTGSRSQSGLKMWSCAICRSQFSRGSFLGEKLLKYIIKKCMTKNEQKKKKIMRSIGLKHSYS